MQQRVHATEGPCNVPCQASAHACTARALASPALASPVLTASPRLHPPILRSAHLHPQPHTHAFGASWRVAVANTYQKIDAENLKQWQFARIIIILEYKDQRDPMPPPLNVFSAVYALLHWFWRRVIKRMPPKARVPGIKMGINRHLYEMIGCRVNDHCFECISRDTNAR